MNARKLIILLAIVLGGSVVRAAEDIAKHVFILGVDGWGSYSVPHASDIPTLQRMMEEGCYTLKKRCEVPSISGPNWAAMFNGAPLSMTGYYDNACTPAFLPLRTTKNGTWPNVFYQLRKQRPELKMGAVMEWGDLIKAIDTKSFDYVYTTSQSYVGCREWLNVSKEYVARENPDLLFVHIDQIDHAGHESGHGSEAYYLALSTLDDEIEEFVAFLREKGIYDESIIIVASDHGGIGTSHGGNTLDELEAPFIICGKGVRRGCKITKTMAEMDVAPTIARIFHVESPQCWRGQAMTVYEEDPEGPEDKDLEEEEEENPEDVEAPVADLLDIVFKTTGAAEDVSPLHNTVTRIGRPSVVNDKSIGQTVMNTESAVWGEAPSNYYRVNFTEELHQGVADGFTMECYVKAKWNDPRSSHECNPFSMQQSGGFALLTNTSGIWMFEPYIGSSYQSTNSFISVTKDKWVHLVGVWDKDKNLVHVFVDGNLCNSTYCSGDLKLAVGDLCQWICIGGDVSGNGGAESGFQGRIATARLYDAPLTKAQVTALYRKVTTPTNVSSVKAERGDSDVYGLSGIQVEADAPGIVIEDGMKRLNK